MSGSSFSIVCISVNYENMQGLFQDKWKFIFSCFITFFIYFMYWPTFRIPCLIPFSLSHPSPQLPSTFSPSISLPFRKRQASHGYQQNKAYKIEAAPSSFRYQGLVRQPRIGNSFPKARNWFFWDKTIYLKMTKIMLLLW